tara:strand:+ start:169 stop:501 length:333 start_codon:yes stop_codon:yes gene_type:complete
MNKSQLRERVVRRLYGDAWRDNWKTVPEALEIALYKDEWKKDIKPLKFLDILEKSELLRQWHTWFAKNNVSRLDYEISTIDTQIGGRPHAEVYIREDTVRALFKLTHFKG